MAEYAGREPFLFGAEEGVSGQCLGAHCTTRLPSAATGGALGVTELRVPPGAETPLHLHRNEDEILHVLEGDFRFWCGEWEQSAGAGATSARRTGWPSARCRWSRRRRASSS